MNDEAARPALEASHAYCHVQTRRHARSFYFASMALPKEKKRATYAVYAFCRYADDLVDRNAGGDVAVALARVSQSFDRMVAGELHDPPFAPAFAWAVGRFGIEKQPFLDLLKGVSMDLGPVRIADWPQLRDYCYHVASVVGLMMARIFELRDDAGRERAVDLGIAMQLTNILRDVGEDFAMGRVYLPADEMASVGVGMETLALARVTDPLRVLLRQQAARAREYYQRAEAGIPLLADDGSQFTVWLMRHVYAGILDEIEKSDYEVLRQRAKTSFARKLLLAIRAWRDYRRTRPSSMIPARKSAPFNFVLRRWLDRTLRQRFHNVYVGGVEHLRGLAPTRPVVGCVNHTNWWDGFVLYVLSHRFLPHNMHLAMEEKNLRRYRFLHGWECSGST